MTIHQRYRVWLYDLKIMVNVTEMSFKTHILHYEGMAMDGDHPASELMESTLLYVGSAALELWESDIVRVPTLLGLSSADYAVEWYFQRWVLRDVIKKTIKEITQSALKNYRIIGHIY